MVGTSSADRIDVWTCGNGPTDKAYGTSVVSIVNGFYSKMVAMMGGAPLADTGETWKADTNIDIYVLASGQQVVRGNQTSTVGSEAFGQAVPTDQKGTTASGWIAIDASGGISTYFKGALAHEFFHLEQFRTNLGVCGTARWWFVEASATWAGAYFVPASATQVYTSFYPQFEMNPTKALNDTSNDSSGVSHSYGAFIWPYFMQQQAGGAQTIGNVWKSVRGLMSCVAMDGKLNGVAAFSTYFKKFALENLDSPLPNYNADVTSIPDNFGPTYQKQVSSFPHYYPALGAPNAQSAPTVKPSSYTLPANPSKDSYPFMTTVPAKLDVLSAQYNFFKIRPDYNDVQFDFSQLPKSVADVTLIGQEVGATKSTAYHVVPLDGSNAHVCIALDLKGTFGQSVQSKGAAFWVIVDNPSLTAGLESSYTVTVRSDCAATVSGTLTDTEKLTLTQGSDPVITQMIAENDTWNVQVKDTKGGFNTTGTSVGFDVTTTLGPAPRCALITGTWSGNAPVSNGNASFTGFGSLAITPQIYGASNFAPITITNSGCGSTTTSSGTWNAIGSFCQAAGESSYGTARTTLGFTCADPASNSQGAKGTFTGGGTLTATDVDACGLWTPGCSIKTST